MELSKKDVDRILFEMSSEQRDIIKGIADETMLRWLPRLCDDEVSEFITDSFVDLMIDEIKPTIKNLIYNYLGRTGFKCYAPFFEFRDSALKLIKGDVDEESY